jgi:predicted nucleic-acid-binding Zn-ribbon protein
MKNSRKCIKCDCEAIWKIDPLSLPDPDSSNVVLPVPVGVREIDNPDPGLIGRPFVRTAVGTFDVYVCARCGYSELWAKDIEDLGKLRKGPPEGNGTKVMRLKKRDE